MHHRYLDDLFELASRAGRDRDAAAHRSGGDRAPENGVVFGKRAAVGKPRAKAASADGPRPFPGSLSKAPRA